MPIYRVGVIPPNLTLPAQTYYCAPSYCTPVSLHVVLHGARGRMIRFRIKSNHYMRFSHPEGEAAMIMLARAGSIALAGLCLLAGEAAAQPAKPACTSSLTPQAIAAVRGTRWAVDAEGGKTSVFVVNGRVNVARAGGRGRVDLGPGEGVDVEPSGQLIVKRWPAPRVAALMARLGQ